MRTAPRASSTPQTVPYGITMVQADQVSRLRRRATARCASSIPESMPRTKTIWATTSPGINLSGSGDWSTDEAHHGTHVAGTIAAVNNSIGVVGVLPNTKLNLYIAKVFNASGTAPSSTIAKAMLSCRKAGAERGQHVARRLEREQARAAGRHVSRQAQDPADRGGGQPGRHVVWSPAGFAEVVSVAAVDSSKAHASFSQSNADVELSGPGVSVLSTVPMGTGADASAAAGGTNYAVIGVEG